MHISTNEARGILSRSDKPFAKLFTHGTLEVEIYQPHIEDHQQPHSKDEVYIIISGEGDFFLEGKITAFKPGDFLFVPAGAEHRFINFSDNFSTWVFFYGPEGGEK
ncbi:cupin domain [Anseongella ginsenosidimutans]|uniref:Cupin domain n=1 Tax=Anseongella ginsenosidimutans TaxID=496056 RepID=A0A4R3KM95_9SPHI|nr:cupin domain-containing protein [Anseongella ginsenosidimutans]QEC51902.1 cupin domain-containing protein [Anseongella ginsenosidimutans]TCS85075.1 cupin domain [Anseongella ginsenosidimutans]